MPRAKIKDLNFAVYDPGIFLSLSFAKKAPVKIASAQPLRCRTPRWRSPFGQGWAQAQLGENIDPASNIGLQFAEHVTFDCK